MGELFVITSEICKFHSERKRTVFYGLETISYRAPQLWTILPEEFKQRNTISLFKSDVRQWICNECPCRLCKVFVPNLGFIWGTTPNVVLIFIMDILTRVYIYIYTSPLAGRYMFNWEYTGNCCYLKCISLHLPILSI